MRKIIVAYCFHFILFSSCNVQAMLASDAVLAFTNGGYQCDVSGTYPNCEYDAYTVTNSWFGFDGDGNQQYGGGTESFGENERIALAMDQGIRLGVTQPTTGRAHSGAPTGSEITSIDHAWEFFGNTGMHNTVSPITVVSDDGLGHVELDFSGWRVDWDIYEDIDMGGDSANFPDDTGIATVTCGSDCSMGDTFILDYTAHVPMYHPSGFGAVYYGLHLEGIVSAVPLPPTAWLLTSGMLALVGIAKRRCASSMRS